MRQFNNPGRLLEIGIASLGGHSTALCLIHPLDPVSLRKVDGLIDLGPLVSDHIIINSHGFFIFHNFLNFLVIYRGAHFSGRGAW
jgi:hypothetical protein